MTYWMPPNVPMHIDNECHEEVERRGELQPCEREAIGYRIDPNGGGPYPVCRKHSRPPYWMSARAELAYAQGPRERRCAVVGCETFPDAAWSLCTAHLAQIEAEVEADNAPESHDPRRADQVNLGAESAESSGSHRRATPASQPPVNKPESHVSGEADRG